MAAALHLSHLMLRLLGIAALGFGCTADVDGIAGQQDDPERETGSNTGEAGKTELTLSDYFGEIAQIHCDQAFQCRDSYPTDRGEFSATWGTSNAQCSAGLVAAWMPASLETEIAKGRVKFDGNAATACLNGVTFAACPDYWNRGIEWADACYKVVVGLVEPGGACELNYSCTTYNCDPATRSCQ